MNYAGHKLYKHAIDLLHSSAKEYTMYLKSKSYNQENISDNEAMLQRGIAFARKAGLELQEGYEVPRDDIYIQEDILQEFKSSPKKIANPISIESINRIFKSIIEISEEKNDKINKQNERELD